MRNKILILDDDEDILYFCSVVFENLDFEHISAAHSKDIIRLLEEVNPEISLIDVWIPGLGGVRGAQTLNATSHLKDIPVIIVSAKSNFPTLAEEAGPDSCL